VGVCPEVAWIRCALDSELVVSDVDRRENPVNHLIRLVDIMNETVVFSKLPMPSPASASFATTEDGLGLQ
jgi:hypothetical protein